MSFSRSKLSILVLSSALLVICVLLLASWKVISRVDAAARGDLVKSLSTVVGVTSQAVTSWVKEQKSDAQIWATSPDVLRHTETLFAAGQNARALKASSAQKMLRQLFQPVLASKGYPGFFIIGPRNINLASARDSNLGIPSLLISQKKFLETIWSGSPAMSLPMSSDVPLQNSTGLSASSAATMFVGAPIRNSAGKIVAALAFRIDPGADFSDIFLRGRIGQSGETYAFDIAGRMISETRFRSQIKDLGIIDPGLPENLDIELRDPGVNLTTGERSTTTRNKLPLTRMARDAVAGKSGFDVQGYRDYRGVDVVGAWIWDDRLGMGMTTEVDVEEAFKALETNKTVLYLATVLIVMLIAALVVFLEFYRARERSKQELDNLLQNITQGVVTFDSNRRLRLWNDSYQKILGFPDGLLKAGLQVEILVSNLALRGSYGDGPANQLARERLEKIWGNAITRSETTPDDGKIYETITQLLDDGGLIVTYSDITEREHSQAEIVEQRDLLNELNRQKNKFFSIIAHDLLGPFTVLLNYTEILKRSAQTESRDKIIDISSSLNQATEQTLKLLEDLLEWTRNQMNQVAFEPAPCDIAELSKSALEELSFIAREKNVALFNNIKPLTIVADEQMTRTIIRNLVSNAIKFTHGGGNITVSALQKDDSIEIEVSDTGIGMIPERAASIFELGDNQSTPGTSGETGTGLGLILCKEFVDKHGGMISAKSQLDKGSRFRFSLPINGPNQAA